MRKKFIFLFFVLFLITQLPNHLITSLFGADFLYQKDLKVPFAGSPTYIAGATIGNPLSDYGSHFGTKIDLRDSTFSKMVVYSCLANSQKSGEIHYLHIYLENEQQYFNPAEKRAVKFFPWGWEETAKSGPFSATSTVVFLDTDVLFIWVRFKNETDQFQKAIPNISLPSWRGTNYRSECMWITPSFPLTSEFDEEENLYLLTAGDIAEAIVPSGKITEAGEEGFVGQELVFSGGEEKNLYLVIGFSAKLDESSVAIELAKKQIEKIQKSSPAEVLEGEKQKWEEFFSSAPHPCWENKEYQQIYWDGLTGLRMIQYKPRNQMTYQGATPCKVRFCLFWCWDTGFQVLGMSEWSPQIARENLAVLYQTQDEKGMVNHQADDTANLHIRNISQSPVHGWPIVTIYERFDDRGKAKEFAEEFYPKLADYMEWWRKYRDANEDGLCEFSEAYESGWDDSPRFPGRGQTKTSHIDAVDLNCWIYQNYQSLAYLAKELNKLAAEKVFEQNAEKLGELIDRKLWDSEGGGWFDLNTDENTLIKVLTPAMWFPAFVGATQNLARVKQVIDQHLLDPQEFFGKYPIPSVAYNDPNFNKEGEGLYWRGNIWPNIFLTAAITLYEYGYEEETQTLVKNYLEMVKNKGGLYEEYNSLNGDVGWCSAGVGAYAAFQLGWGCSVPVELVLRRYEHFRWLLSRCSPCRQCEGFIKTIADFTTREVFFEVNTGEYEVGLLDLHSLDDKPLKETDNIYLKITDPYDNLKKPFCKVTFPGLEILQVTCEGTGIPLVEPHSFSCGLGKEYIIMIGQKK